MTKYITLKEWQESFKAKNVVEPPKAPSKNETTEFNTRLDGIINNAGRVAVRKYQSKIQSVLHQIDLACADIATELVRNRSSEGIYTPFSNTWNELKKLIWEIEVIGSECETSTANT